MLGGAIECGGHTQREMLIEGKMKQFENFVAAEVKSRIEVK